MNKGHKLKSEILLISIFALILMISDSRINDPVNYQTTPLSSAAIIYINGNAQFSGKVDGGGGSSGNPYYIQNRILTSTTQNGIEIYGTTAYLEIRHCKISTSNNDGIIASGCSNIRIWNCTFTSCYLAFYFTSSYSITLENCTFTTCATGIEFFNNGRQSIFRTSKFNSCGTGMHIWGGSNNRIENNNFTGGDTGIIVRDTSYLNNFTNNRFNGLGYSVYDIDGGDFNRFTQNYVISGPPYCVRTRNSAINNSFINNNITGMTGSYDVQLDSAVNTTFRGNILNNQGLDLLNAEDSIFDEFNTIKNEKIYYYEDKKNLNLNSLPNPGQLILVNCSNLKVSKFNSIVSRWSIISFKSQNISVEQSDLNSVHLRASKSCKVEKCNVSTTIYGGIYLSNTNSSFIKHCITQFNSGLDLISSYHNIIDNLSTPNVLGEGILVRYGFNNTLSRIYSKTNYGYEGLYVYSTSNLTIKDSDFSYHTSGMSTNGMKFLSCNNITLQNVSSGYNTYYGIELMNVNNTRFIQCNFTGNSREGIFAQNLNNGFWANNTIYNHYYSGIRLLSAKYLILKNNEIKENNLGGSGGEYGIFAQSCSNLSFVQNNVVNNRNHGIYADGCHNNTFDSNNYTGNYQYQLYSNNCDNITVVRNYATSSNYGFLFASCDYSRIESNNLSNMMFRGIVFSASTHNQIKFNNVSNNNRWNTYGITLQTSSNYNEISFNFGKSNERNIYLTASHYNNISFNQISDSNFGYYLSSSHNNLLRNNSGSGITNVIIFLSSSNTNEVCYNWLHSSAKNWIGDSGTGNNIHDNVYAGWVEPANSYLISNNLVDPFVFTLDQMYYGYDSGDTYKYFAGNTKYYHQIYLQANTLYAFACGFANPHEFHFEMEKNDGSFDVFDYNQTNLQTKVIIIEVAETGLYNLTITSTISKSQQIFGIGFFTISPMVLYTTYYAALPFKSPYRYYYIVKYYNFGIMDYSLAYDNWNPPRYHSFPNLVGNQKSQNYSIDPNVDQEIPLSIFPITFTAGRYILYTSYSDGMYGEGYFSAVGVSGGIPPPAPILITQNQTIAAENVTIEWNNVPEATLYLIYVDGILNGTTSNTFYEVQLHKDGEYEIYVIAHNDAGDSSASGSIFITVNLSTSSDTDTTPPPKRGINSYELIVFFISLGVVFVMKKQIKSSKREYK